MADIEALFALAQAERENDARLRGVPLREEPGTSGPEPAAAEGRRAAAGASAGAPPRKRARKTPEQQLAEAEERVRRLRAQIAQRERKERTRRLIASAATIEKWGCAELDEESARTLGCVWRAMRAARDAGGSADLDAAERLARAGRALADAASD